MCECVMNIVNNTIDYKIRLNYYLWYHMNVMNKPWNILNRYKSVVYVKKCRKVIPKMYQ